MKKGLPTRVLPAQVNGQTCGVAAVAAVAARAGKAQGNAFAAYLNAEPHVVERIQTDLHRQAARIGAPWPRFLGTSPWALAALAGRATGGRYVVRSWGKQTRARVDTAVSEGADVFIYVGGDGRPATRLIPRHVVVILGSDSTRDHYGVFEPSTGRVMMVPRDSIGDIEPARKPHWGNWNRPLLAVVPQSETDWRK